MAKLLLDKSLRKLLENHEDSGESGMRIFLLGQRLDNAMRYNYVAC